MIWLTRLRHFLRSLLISDRLDRDLDDELASAVEELAGRHRRAGVPGHEARRRALLEMGGVAQVAEASRAERLGAWLGSLAADARFGVRLLRRSPAFAVTVVTTLAIAIGATTAIFSAVRVALLEPLPYAESSQLVYIWSDLTAAGYPRAPLSAPELADLRARSTAFSSLAALWPTSLALTEADGPEQWRLGRVTGNFFDTLGIDAALGRLFAEADEVTALSDPTVVISWPTWQRRFGGDPAVLGRRVELETGPVTIIGVLPRHFRVWLPREAGVPPDLDAFQSFPRQVYQQSRTQYFLRVIGRLSAGMPIAAANAQLTRITADMGREFAEYGQTSPEMYAVDLHADGVRDLRPALLALFAAVAILLVLAGVNSATLLVARVSARRPEYAMRTALGASIGRIARQSLVEGLILAALAAGAGLLVAEVSLRLLVTWRPEALARLDNVQLGTDGLVVAVGVATIWALVFSASPIRALRRGVAPGTDGSISGGARIAGGHADYRLRAGLVTVQMVLGVVLLVSAGLLVQAIGHIERVNLGFRGEGVLTFKVAIHRARFENAPAAASDFLRQLTALLAARPGVSAVGAISHLPFDTLPNWSAPYLREDDTDAETGRDADARAVLPGYFETVRGQLIDGRDFTMGDGWLDPPVAIVDERLADRLWPGDSALGRRLMSDPRATGSAETLVTVVGVVGHQRYRTPTAEVREQIYFPQLQVMRNPLAFVVRGNGALDARSDDVRAVVRSLDATLPVADVRQLDDYVGQASGVPRFISIVASFLAMIALTLASVGTYGLVTYAIGRRRVEFAVRLALGARPAQVVRLVVGQVLGLVGLGMAVGLPAAWLAARLLGSQLYEISPSDIRTYVAAVTLLLGAVLVATLGPGIGAARIRALVALRAD